MTSVVHLANRIELWPRARLRPYERNAKIHDDAQVQQIASSILEFGFNAPILVDGKDGIIAGHGRLLAADLLELPDVPVVVLDHMTDEQRRAYIIADNKISENGRWDHDMLASELADLAASGMNIGLTGFSDDELADLLGAGEEPGDAEPPGGPGGEHEFLAEKFGVPPFSVLDTRQGYWQDRKRRWKAVIGDDGESREETLFKSGSTEASQKMAEIGTVSILDPVLAEIVLRWFCPPRGKTFDTFAGDTVFGYVSGAFGCEFTGIELRQEQADLNNARVAGAGLPARYVCDDGQNVLKHLEPESRDFFFSCPPYFDLEVYSDDPRDASNQGSYSDFVKILDKAFSGAARVLRENRFACVVMSNVRDGRGFYHDICGDIRRIMARNGLHLYNELVLVNAVGSASMRAGNYMRNRKVARTHQNVMMFYKGETGDDIYLKKDFDLLPKLQAIQFHDDVMIFYKGDPSKIQKNLGQDPMGDCGLMRDEPGEVL